MAGQPKQGLDFAGVNVRIFDDNEKIDELIDAQGWAGFSIYFYLCMKAYATNGYYYEWRKTSSATTARRMGGGIKSETVNETLKLCLRIGLFDSRLYDRESILTNREIQTRYMAAIEKRSQSGRTVNKKFWLLNSQETRSYIVIPENTDSLPENGDSLPENATKKSKVKESKEKKSNISEPAAHGGDVNPKINYSEITELFNSICTSLPKVKTLTDKRRAAIKSAYKLVNGDFTELFKAVEASDFLTGRSGNWNGCGFDWVLKSANITKILEGNYKNKEEKKNGHKSEELWEDTTGLYF